MVVSAQHLASEAGAEVLRAGGNAVDAAVAVGYALAVVDPCCGNIGGGGFMTLHLADGHAAFLNFREKAPGGGDGGHVPRRQGRGRCAAAACSASAAVGVPGTVLGLDTALARYGTLPRARVMAAGDPARARRLRAATRRRRRCSRGSPTAARPRPGGSRRSSCTRTARHCRPASGSCSRPGGDPGGDRDPRSGRVLSRARSPAAVATAAQADGGMMTAADFADYTVTESPPLRCTYRGYASSSRRRRRVLRRHHAVRDPERARGLRPARAWASTRRRSVHLLVEAMRHAFVDRNHAPRRSGFRRTTRSSGCCRRTMPPRSAPRSARQGDALATPRRRRAAAREPRDDALLGGRRRRQRRRGHLHDQRRVRRRA